MFQDVPERDDIDYEYNETEYDTLLKQINPDKKVYHQKSELADVAKKMANYSSNMPSAITTYSNNHLV